MNSTHPVSLPQAVEVNRIVLFVSYILRLNVF
jgi:hypothetical protein